MTTQRHSPFALQRSALGALTSSLIHFSKDLERLTDQITATNDNGELLLLLLLLLFLH